MNSAPLLVLLPLAWLAGCAATGQDRALAERVDAVLAPLVAANEFSGAVVLARHGKVLYQRGFGMANHAAGVEFTTDTPTDGASLAKTFAAAGVAWLTAEGRIDPDAPVTRYLPEFPHPQTTLGQLLAHTNGLPPYYEFFDPHFAPDEVRTTEAMLRVVAREVPAPAFEPGSRFEYSNFGYDLAALAIERVTGQPYETFLNERFFVRLGMATSFARPARLADWQGVRTLGYRWRDSGWQVVDVFDMEAFLGASNLYFSAADLARWGSANAAGTALPKAALPAVPTRGLIDGRPSPINQLSWYCDADDGVRCYYTGSLNAFHSLVYWDRERDEAVALVSNSSLPPWHTITLQRDLVDALAGRPRRTELPPKFERFDKSTRPLVSGTYLVDAIGPLVVHGGPGGVRVRAGAGLEFDAFQVSAQVFYVPGPDWWLAFSAGRPPAVVHLRSMFVDAVGRREAGPAGAPSPE